MIVESDRIVTFDVDDSLVMWSYPPEKALEAIHFQQYGQDTYLLPHKEHIKMLKDFKLRGAKVIVWSQSGWEWAKEVVRVLGLTQDVDVIMSKPMWYVDDLPCTEWMKNRIYKEIK